MSSEKKLLDVKSLKKYYEGIPGFKLLVLDDVNFSFEAEEDKGKIITILAPLGAGKSTLLKIIAGIEKPSEGEIYLNEKIYSAPEGRVIYIPEKFSSFPWYDVRDNIGLAPRLASKEDDNNINNLISVVGLTGYEDHFPHNKSLGFRFRISLARALAVNPKLVLIDDAFRNMDSFTRNEIYQLVINISNELNINFIHTTANIHEAIFLSDEILLMKMNPGTIFKKINLQNKIPNENFIINDEVISLRNEIESYFRSENIEDAVNFSI